MWLKKSITEAHWELNHWNEKKTFLANMALRVPILWSFILK